MLFRTCIAIAAILFAGPVTALTIKPGAAWPGPMIPVCWEAPQREHAQERDLIRKAVGWTWERESAVRFTGWRACDGESGGVRVALETKLPQTRARGRELDGMARGMILPSLWSLAALSVNLKAPVHEFGHALGFGHEYARADLADPARCGVRDASGALYLEDDAALTPYDPHSIMVGCVAGATIRFSLGTPALSAADIFGLVRIYGSNPDNILDQDEPGDRFGAALAAEDFDDDGEIDLAVAARGEDGEGAVYLFQGDAHRGFRPWRRLSAADLDKGGDRRFAALLNLPPAEIGAAHWADIQDDLAQQPFGDFPTLGDARGAVLVDVDLDGDGAVDRVLGAPHGRAAVDGSGVVIVFRGGAGEEGFTPWYWFGQAY